MNKVRNLRNSNDSTSEATGLSRKRYHRVGVGWHRATTCSSHARSFRCSYPLEPIEGVLTVGTRYNAQIMSEEPTNGHRGSQRAYAAQLYARYSEGLLAFFRASIPIAKEDAMDLLQQTFVELLKWQDNGLARTIQHPRAFLFTIAHRRLLVHRDKQHKTPDQPQQSDPQMDERAHRDDLEYLSALHEGQRGLLRAMRHIQDLDLQVVLYLRFWEGLTEEGVASVLGRPRGTIAGQLRRARTLVQAELGRMAETEPGPARTSTTMLERWWRQLEDRAHGVELENGDE